MTYLFAQSQKVSILLYNINNLTSDICLHTVKWLNSSDWPRDGTLTGNTTPGRVDRGVMAMNDYYKFSKA